MLVKPNWLRREARRGFAPATYAYAHNNPIRYVHRNGLSGQEPGPPKNYDDCVNRVMAEMYELRNFALEDYENYVNELTKLAPSCEEEALEKEQALRQATEELRKGMQELERRLREEILNCAKLFPDRR